MTGLKAIRRLLRLKDLKVVDAIFKQNNVLLLTVKPCKNGCRCPVCSRRGRIVRTRTDMQSWRDVTDCSWSGWLQ